VDLQLVEEQLPEGSELRGIQRGALDSIDHLDRTVSGVLQIARSGRITLESVDVRDPLRAALRAVDPIAAEVGATLRADLDFSPLLVAGDTSALQQLFTNLLTNAVQAVERGGMVDAYAAGGAEEVTVVIRDNGRGIPADQLSRVREPFYSTRSDGTGLGLAFADRIAIAHRAEIRIESGSERGKMVEVSFVPAGTSRSDASS
jgi:signal transduction histidine kinase